MRKLSTDESDEKADIFKSNAILFGFGSPVLGFTYAVTMMLLFVGTAITTNRIWKDLQSRNLQYMALEKEFFTEQNRFLALQSEFSRNEEILKVLQSPNIEVVQMNGLNVSPTGYGKVIWNPVDKSAILQLSNLPAVPSNKDYQLWVIKDKKPVSAGVFSLNDPERECFFKINELIETDKKNINAFEITLEPKGGVSQPTGDIYLLSRSMK